MVTPGGVNLGGSVTFPGGAASPGAGSTTNPGPRNGAGTGIGTSAGSGAGPGGGAAPAAPACDPRTEICRDSYTVTMPLDGRGPVTLSDLVNFRPVAGIQHMEPNGWTVVGLDTNFFADTGAHVQNNLLLGVPASVRFTPVAYHWEYGDGASANRSTKGGSWAALGIAEFGATPTSHVYRQRGIYRIDLTIDFRAEYRFGPSEWIPIAGTVPVVSNRLTSTAGNATTVLVDRDCTVSRAGPGC